MKYRIILTAMLVLFCASIGLSQSQTGGRGTIVKDVTYFDSDGNLVVPKVTADEFAVGDIESTGDMTVSSNFSVTGTSTLGTLTGYLFGTAGVVGTTQDGSSWTNIPASGLDVESDVESVLDAADNDAIRTAISVPADSEVWGSASVTIGDIVAAQRITTNTVAMLDTSGTAKADYALTRIWMSESEYGSASANNIEEVTLTGTEVEEVLANGDYWQVTASTGEITATITGTAAGTNYLNVSVGANITSEAIVLTD
jgi:hypothetical protein